MRLKKIKLAGFKSFVDPTTVPVSTNLIGVVGPNGCGKSNIIDAVRWVMGESSAKHLRGDSMSDVIFSGSNARKPVGKASVELVFDNSDGKAPGQYASYAEISIRREATRDGQSNYYLNKTRCRRKDITDLFLGTGLGPRTYSIIEQGMVTRIIEARPEELRSFLEEAAGISKYKERRRETENRIRHTRENLERVHDIRSELETQLRKLKRQSQAAAKYKELKQEERFLRAQLLALRWKRLAAQLQTHDGALSAKETELQGIIAAQREIEAHIEDIRSRQSEAGDHHGKVQAEYYEIGAEISGIEQQIQHARETRAQWQREHEQVSQSWEQASQHLGSDKMLHEQLSKQLEQSAPELQESTERHARAVEALQRAEQAMQTWQSDWQGFNEVAAEPRKAQEIQRSRMQQLEQQLAQLRTRKERLEQEAAAIDDERRQDDVESLRNQAREADQACEDAERFIETTEARIKDLRARREALSSELETLRGEAQKAEARLASLEELQAAAQGKRDEALNRWLAERGLGDAPRLSTVIGVDEGWERAVEKALGARLAAVCVDGMDVLAGDIEQLEQSELMLVERGAAAAGGVRGSDTLLSKVHGDADVSALLAGIYVADTLADAMAMRGRLAPAESVITRSGVWVGRNWISLVNQEGARAGMLERQREIEALGRELETHARQIEEHAASLQALRQEIQESELQRDTHRRELVDRNKSRNELHARLGHSEAHVAQLNNRAQQIDAELQEIGAQLDADAAALSDAERLLQEALRLSGSHEQRREALQADRARLETELEHARREADETRERQHLLDVERQRMQSTLESTEQSVMRLEQQLEHLIRRREELQGLLAEGERPELALKEKLEQLLQNRVAVEARLAEARQAVSELETELREREKARLTRENAAQEVRQELEQQRVTRQELVVRRDTLADQMQETKHTLEEAIASLPDEAGEEQWIELLEKTAKRIERLGPINLVAIEEYEEQSERKGYLDKQYEDLTQALNTLEEAIRKIDRETRTRFKETFDKVNSGMQSFFPRLFGGGHAYLELTGDDLLEAGVAVMARPPGKRNSTIHLLSGGEKALTAVALVFSIFQLNPAPFCLLDEVDAPLDDANVERYSETLKEMSQETQLLYITHNKISMEVADFLLGVTMAEAGVSRLVTVDVDEAMEMVV